MIRKTLLFSILCLCISTHASSVKNSHHKDHISYAEVFHNHKLNTSDKWENYLEIYDDTFQKFIGKSPNTLEIGVQNGGGLQIFSKYFINANVYGIDIDPKVCEQKLGKNITTYCFSATDVKRVEENFKNIQFDVIVDDGSHISSEVIAAFQIFFSKLKPGGVYLIEDLHTSYWDSHQGGYLKENASIEFLKKFVDLLNFYHIKDENFLKKISEKDRYVFEWLESITFYDSVAVIKKRMTQRAERYKRMVVGKFQPVVPSIDSAKKDDDYYSH